MRLLYNSRVLTVVGLVVLGIFVFYFKSSGKFINFIVGPSSYLYKEISIIANSYDKFSNWRNLSGRVEDLEKENTILLSRLGQDDALVNENEALRRALDLPNIKNYTLIDAQVSSITFQVDGYDLVLNKGADDGIEVGDVVIAPEGFLIGVVFEVEDNYSNIMTVVDTRSKITIKNIDSETSGIAKGALGEGMVLDFVSQNDEININDLMVTNGNDQYPPGLIVGKVSSVQSPTGELFRVVKIKPFIQESKFSRVLVLKQ